MTGGRDGLDAISRRRQHAGGTTAGNARRTRPLPRRPEARHGRQHRARRRAAAARHRRAGHRQDDAGVVDCVGAGPRGRCWSSTRAATTRRATRCTTSTTCCASTTRRPATPAPSSSSRTSAGRRSARPSGAPSSASCSSTRSTRRRATFPNDLLDELDRMEFRVPELALTCKATHRPVVVITSNSERQLPDPFLRRCIFHRLDFPSGERLQAILRERLGPPRSAAAA